MDSTHKLVIRNEILKRLRAKEQEFKDEFGSLNEEVFRHKFEGLFRGIVREGRMRLAEAEQREMFEEVISFFLGLGPLDKLLKDPEITEIMVNGPYQVFIEKKGKIEPADVSFTDEEQLGYFIERILSPVGRRVTEYEPCVDARLKDGSRVNVVRSPVSGIGSILTIRKFLHRIFGPEELVRLGSVTPGVLDFLKACVGARCNILVSGGAGAGKTTLLNVLFSFVGESERVITIEDTRELRARHMHIVPMETRPPSIEGKGEISIRDLFRNALHMRPDRIIVGEVRSSEVLDMIQAMNTGHEGSMTTLHANAELEALDRVEILALMAKMNISSEVIKRQIINAFDVIVQLTRFPDGSRKTTGISEVIKARDYELRPLFVWDESAGTIVATGQIPSFSERLRKVAGYDCGVLKEGR